MGIINGTFDTDLSGWQYNTKVSWSDGKVVFNACTAPSFYFSSDIPFMSQRFLIDNTTLSFEWATGNNLCCPDWGTPTFILELIIHEFNPDDGTPINTTVISEMFPGRGSGTKIKDVSPYLGKEATLQLRSIGGFYCASGLGWYNLVIDNVNVSPNWGTFRVSSVPGNANIYVDDNFLNITPETGSIDLTDISPGSHTIKITKTDYYDYSVTVDVYPGRIYEIIATLNPQIGCISILSDPIGAKIFLSDRNGEILNDTGFTTFKNICNLFWGDYKWKLILPRYDPKSGIAHLTSVAGVSITETLALTGIGCIYFESNPSGAKIIVDDVDTGLITPNKKCGLSLGEHTYRLELSGYKIETGDVILTSTQGETVSTDLTVLAPANIISATLTVDTNDCVAPCTVNGTVSWTNTGDIASIPTDLKILVNTVPTILRSSVTINPGQTLSYTFQLPSLSAGTYTVCASPDTGTVCQTITVRIPAAKGSIRFTSTPIGAEIFLDGAVQGIKTPATLIDVPVGSHAYTLKLDGFNDSTGTVQVLENQTVEVSALLIPIESCIYFVTSIPGAKIYVDDVDTGKVTPALICGLSLGSHTYRLELSGYTAVTGSVGIGAGQGVVVASVLTPVEKGIGAGTLIGLTVIGIGVVYFATRKRG